MFSVTLCFLLIVSVSGDYWAERQAFIDNERAQSFGSKIKLSPAEEKFNTILMKVKYSELEMGFQNPKSFPPAMHFCKAKSLIDSSRVFKIIQQMPKGGLLHGHDFSLVSLDYIIKNITYRDHLYICQNFSGIHFIFMDPPRLDACYQSVKILRSQAKSAEIFDSWLMSKMSILCNYADKIYSDVNAVWNDFVHVFKILIPLLTYKPVFEDHFYRTLQEFYEDNVKYMEIRGTLPPIYELNGETWSPVETVGMMKNVTNRFKSIHPSFIGARFIYAPYRHVGNITMKRYIRTYRNIKKIYPNFLVGFDIVGQEDLGRPTEDFVSVLLNNNISYFFHAGETNWNGMTDSNLIDAILLKTTRIGHGFALTKHPLLLQEVKRRNIAIEINPISNQVLRLVADLRNHPANMFFAQDMPLVISADDLSFWGAKGLSYDFYEAFMGMTHKKADLRTLKQLAINSFTYSALQEKEKDAAFALWERDWNDFIAGEVNPKVKVVVI